MATSNAGNVTVRFSVQDEQAVRKALEQLGKDGEAALRRMNAAGQQPQPGLNALSSIVEGLRGRILGLAVPLGSVGSGLISLGPAGVVAAAAVGGVMLAFESMTEAAVNLAERSRVLKEFSEVTGLTIRQMKLLQSEGAKVGIDSERSGAGIAKFTVEMESLRRGTGSALEILQRVSPELARELAAAISTADGISILARAYVGLDTERRNALSKAFFGRGNIDFGQLLDEVGAKGGVAALEQSALAAGKAIDERLVKRLAQLKVEIEETNKRTKALTTSFFAETVLEKELRAAQYWERMAKAAKELQGTQLPEWLTQFFTSGGIGLAMQGSPIENARQLLAVRMAGGFSTNWAEAWQNPSWRSSPAGGGTHASPGADQALRNVPASGGQKVSAELRLSEMVKWTSLLGEALSPAERYEQALLKIAAAQERGGISAGVAARATRAALVARDQEIVSARERLGIATEEEIVTVRLAALQEKRSHGFIRNAGEMAVAERLLRKEAEGTAEAIAIRTAAFPGLKQLEIEGGKLDRGLDRLGTELSGNLSSSLADFADGSKKAGEAIAGMERQVVRSIVEMVAKMTIGKLAAEGFQGAFSWFSGLFGGAASGGGASVSSITASAMGNVFGPRGRLIPFASGGVVGSPSIAPMALFGERGPEAIMPLRRLPGGDLGVRASGGGGPSVMQVVVQNQSRSQVEVQERRGPDGQLQPHILVRDATDSNIASGEHDEALEARFGIRPRVPRR